MTTIAVPWHEPNSGRAIASVKSVVGRSDLNAQSLLAADPDQFGSDRDDNDDIMMLGWHGPLTLAAGSLGLNLYFAPMIFGLGLMIATSPMLAIERGRTRHSIR